MKHFIWILILMSVIAFSTAAQDSNQQQEIENLRDNCLGQYGDTGSMMSLCLTYATCLVMTPTAECPNPYQQQEIEYVANLCLSSYSDFGNNAELCRAYATCLVMTPTSDCQTEQVIRQYEDCQSMGRNDCEAYSVMLLSKSNLPFSTLSDEERNLRGRAFNSYIEGNYEDALSYMQGIFIERGISSYYYHILPIAYGILQSRNDFYDEAIVSYTQSIQIQYDNPLAHYFRAQAYLALGETISAERDAYIYQLQADEVLQATFTPLEVNFERPDMQRWIAYPVVGLGSNPGGDTFSNLTILEAIPIELAVLEDETIALTSVTSTTEDTIQFLSLVSPDSENAAFEIQQHLIRNATQYAIVRNVQGQPGLCCGEGSGLILTDYGEYFVYVSYRYGGEAGFEIRGVLFPADFPDPRESLPPRICEGSPRTNFAIGDNIGYWALRVYSEPSNDSEIMSANGDETPVTIVEGPLCTEDAIWWQVEYGADEALAWVKETRGTTYIELPSGYTPSTDVRNILGLDSP